MKSFFAFILDTGKIVLLALLIVLPIRIWIFQPFLVKGDSMVPNFHNGDYLLIDEASYGLFGHSPQRGEVIVFKYPRDISQRYIKRVIGLPGETVELSNNVITIVQGAKQLVLKELYLPNGLPTLGTETITLGINEYFVLGDNRPYSSDSRIWGVVPSSDIIGRVLVRIFPPTVFTLFAVPSYN